MVLDPAAALDPAEVEQLISLLHPDPHHLLGAHPIAKAAGGPAVVIRAFRPDALAVTVVPARSGEGRTVAARKLHPAGLFEARIEGSDRLFE